MERRLPCRREGYGGEGRPTVTKLPFRRGGWRSRENQTSRRNCVRKKINGMGEATLPGKDTLGSALKTTGAQALGETRVKAPRQESSSVGGFKKHRGPGGWSAGGEAVEAGSGQDLRGRGKRFVFHYFKFH